MIENWVTTKVTDIHEGDSVRFPPPKSHNGFLSLPLRVSVIRCRRDETVEWADGSKGGWRLEASVAWDVEVKPNTMRVEVGTFYFRHDDDTVERLGV